MPPDYGYRARRAPVGADLSHWRKLADQRQKSRIDIGIAEAAVHLRHKPRFKMIRAGPRLQPGQRSKRLHLEHVGVGIRLRVAAHVRVGGPGFARVTLDESLAADEIRRPALWVEHADLLAPRCALVLAELDIPAAPGPARIGHVGIGPKHKRSCLLYTSD